MPFQWFLAIISSKSVSSLLFELEKLKKKSFENPRPIVGVLAEIFFNFFFMNEHKLNPNNDGHFKLGTLDLKVMQFG